MTWGGCLHGADSKPLPDCRQLVGDGNYRVVPSILKPLIRFYLGTAQPEGLKHAQMLCRSRVNSGLGGAVSSDISRSNGDLQ